MSNRLGQLSRLNSDHEIRPLRLGEPYRATEVVPQDDLVGAQFHRRAAALNTAERDDLSLLLLHLPLLLLDVLQARLERRDEV